MSTTQQKRRGKRSVVRGISSNWIIPDFLQNELSALDIPSVVNIHLYALPLSSLARFLNLPPDPRLRRRMIEHRGRYVESGMVLGCDQNFPK